MASKPGSIGRVDANVSIDKLRSRDDSSRPAPCKRALLDASIDFLPAEIEWTIFI
jgi:hypothetical protein